MEQKSGKLAISIILAAGIALGGFFPGYYYYKSKLDNNTVTVKGLAEMDVTANLAIWKLKFTVTGNNLAAAQKEISAQTDKVYAFLKQQQFSDAEIDAGRIDTNDLMANPYRNNEPSSIIFDNSSYDLVSYLFTGLNDIKPQMLEEATKNARSAALEFAKSSGSKVGKIRRANQGVFSILPREQGGNSVEWQQIDKTVRVVSTIEYWLD